MLDKFSVILVSKGPVLVGEDSLVLLEPEDGFSESLVLVEILRLTFLLLTCEIGTAKLG